MNRDRFKFRVWDIEFKKYYPASDFCIEDLQDSGDEIIVEQCTGRKDKNGRLIFEGDVVKTIWEERVDWTRLVQHVEHLFEVYYNGMGFSLRNLKTKAGHVMWKSADYEVIGNVHEDEREGGGL